MNSYEEYLADVAPKADAPAPAEPTPQNSRKGFPAFGIPALIMLTLMVIVFILEILTSTGSTILNVRPAMNSRDPVSGYSAMFSRSAFWSSAANSLLYNAIQLGISAALAAALCAIFYAMKKPGTVLLFACLWLIPFSVPYIPSLYVFRVALPVPSYLLSTVLQTVSWFCFCGGLFTYLNLRKKGKAGGGPYIGLLVGVLVWMLSLLTNDGLRFDSLFRSLDRMIVTYCMRYEMETAAAGAVLKIVFQVLLAAAPAIVLAILGKGKSTRGKTPLTVLWIFLAMLTVGVAGLFLGGRINLGSPWGNAVANSLVLAVVGGAFGGLLAYSFIHLMRRVPAFLFAAIAVILAAAMSCLSSQYSLIRDLGLYNTFFPYIIFAAFDGRLILVVTVLSFVLRSCSESKPGSLALAVALLAGAFLWGDFNLNAIYSTNLRTVTQVFLQTGQIRYGADAVSIILLIVPPVLMGAGAALLLRRAMKEPKQVKA